MNYRELLNFITLLQQLPLFPHLLERRSSSGFLGGNRDLDLRFGTKSVKVFGSSL